MSFKEAAIKVLKREMKPLHSREIAEIAIKNGYISSNGKTPWATMNAVIITDFNKHKNKSAFKKISPSTFDLNENAKLTEIKEKPKRIPLKEEFVKHAIIKYLSTAGWGHFQYGELHTRGVDIKAKRNGYSRYLYVEAKGSGDLPQSDEVGFIYSVGQIITRMKDSRSTRNYYGIGLPETAAKIAKRRLPWQIAKKLLLIIFSVNSLGEVEEYTWSELKKFQVN